MAIQASVFSGPTHLMAMGHPFCSAAYTDTPGIPLGIDVYSRELVCMDPWRLKDAQVIHSAFGLVLGHKGYGKSSTLKILATRLMLLAAGYQRMRVSINDYKPEGQESEYAKFTAMCRSQVFKVAHSSVNPFEARLFMSPERNVYELGLLGVAEIICEYIHGSKLAGDHGTALRIAVHAMLKHDELLWSPQLLHKLLRSLTIEQVRAYYSQLDQRLCAQLVARSQRLSDANASPSLMTQVSQEISGLVHAADNYRIEDIQQAGTYVASLLERVLFGSYGHMFGESHSLYDTLTQRAVTRDWRDVEPEAEALMRILDTKIKVSAIENNRLDLLPHIELDDEKHKSMGNLTYARSHSFFSEIARGTHTCNLSATHRLKSIRRGGAGSELYELGETIINNLGFVLIGRQNNEPDILDELRERYAITSEADVRQLTTLPRYTFGMKLGEEEKIRFIRVFATPKELTLLGTDAATDRMTDRPDVLDNEDLQRYAKENGIAFLGEHSSGNYSLRKE